MDIEREFIDYLKLFGNTKESDLIEFGVNISHQSKRHIRNILDKMFLEEKIRLVAHNKLGQNVVYVTRDGCCLDELGKEVEADGLGLKDKRNFSEEAGRILSEVAALAEKRSRKKFPHFDKEPSSLLRAGKC